MSIAAKSNPYLLLLLTLVLGIAIGFLGSGLLVRNKIKELRKMQTREGISHSMEQALNLSEAQIPLVRPVLEEYALRMRDLLQEHRIERREEIDRLFEALEPVLDEGQLQELRARTRRIINGISPGGRRGHQRLERWRNPDHRDAENPSPGGE